MKETVRLILPKKMLLGPGQIAEVYIGEKRISGLKAVNVRFEADSLVPEVDLQFDCLSGLVIEYADRE